MPTKHMLLTAAIAVLIVAGLNRTSAGSSLLNSGGTY